MKKYLNLMALVFGLYTSAPAMAEKETIKQPPERSELSVSIDYTRTLVAGRPNNQPGSIFLLAVGGTVLHDTDRAVNVSLHIGGQTYTAPLDPSGEYSFLAWANANRLEVSAWYADNREELISLSQDINLK